MGKNGCGKTMFAKLMNGLIIPTLGDVFVENINTKNPDNYKKIPKIVSMTFQNPDEQIIASCVEDEIAFNLENMCFPGEKMSIKIVKLLKFVELEGYEKRTTESLSGGQKQKLMLACALSAKPKVIILDEITSMIDSIARRNIMKILSKINQILKIAIIMITHDTYEATFAQKIILMKNGEIKIIDKPENILSNLEIIKNFNITPLKSTILLKNIKNNGYDVCLENSLDNKFCAKEIISILESNNVKC